MGWLGQIFSKEEPVGDVIEKADIQGKPKTWNVNPHSKDYGISDLVDSGSWNTHPGTVGMDYHALHAVARIPIIGAIIQTRIQQVAEFCMPQANRYSTGFTVRLRDGEEKMTPAAKREARDIKKILMNGGGQYGFNSFESAMRAILRDSLTFDQANFEIIRNRMGRVTGFLPVDAMTIRRSRAKEKQKSKGQYYGQKYSHVQIINDQICNEYKKGEMAGGIRRPRTWLDVNGYGFPELEELTRVVTDLMNAQTWNSVNFTNGVHAHTILALKSTMSADVFTSFQRHISSMMMGVRNSQRMPIIQLSPEMNEDINAIKLNQNAKDMEYTQWLNFLIKLVCAVYCMDPAELGFVFGNEGQNNAMNSGTPEGRITASRERGLRPLLRCNESWVNEYLVFEINEDFMFDFVGLNELSESDRIALDITTLRSYRTINEVRAEHDLPPLDTDVGDMILDPNYINSALQEKMQAEQPDMGMGRGGDELDGFASDDMGDDFDASDMGAFTEQLAASTNAAIDDGRIIKKSTGKNRSSLVRTTDKSRAYVVEVD